MTGRVARWLELAPGDRWLLSCLLIALPAVSAFTRLFGVVRTIGLLERLTGLDAPHEADATEILAAERLSRLAAIAGRRGFVTATCLPQSLLIYGLLRRRGLSPTLMVGVRRAESAFDAHAWVRLEGVELGQGELDHTPFPIREWRLALR
jgi:hypothetical protein